MFSELPVANGSYALSGNMPVENIECCKITFELHFCGEVFHMEQVFYYGRGGFEGLP